MLWIGLGFAVAYPKLPYFPIEISNTATASPLSHAIFTIGSWAIGPVALYDGHSPLMLLPWLCLVGVTTLEHTHFAYQHMIFVNGMVASALLVMFTQGETWITPIKRILFYAIFYVVRAGLKLVIASHLDLAPPVERFVVDWKASFAEYTSTIHAYHLGRMVPTSAVLLFLRLGAVSQWISFALLGMMLCGII